MKHKKYNINYKDDAGHFWKNARRDIRMEWQRRPWLIRQVGFRGKPDLWILFLVTLFVNPVKLSLPFDCINSLVILFIGWEIDRISQYFVHALMLCPFNPHCNKLTLVKFVGMEEIAHDRLFGDDKGFQGDTGGIRFHKDPSGNIWIFLQRRFLVRYVICLPKFVVIT